MKIVQINATYGKGSTGKIVAMVSQMLTEKGVENYSFYALGTSEYSLAFKYASDKDIKLQALRSRVLGEYGFNSVAQTKRLIKRLDEIAPDVVHLHNLHSHNCHLKMLFAYFREKKIKLYWTFHDCWAFTGYCPYFDIAECEKWKTGCFACPQKKEYSWFFDRSKKLYDEKKKAFSGLDLTIVTPSQWLAELVKESFLKEYPVLVVNNGIDLSVFKPTVGDFREKYGLQDKFILLGVAFDWGKRKGLDVFIELSKRLDDRFKIVLVGTNDAVDKQLPSGILSIHRTQDQQELAQIYTAADLFVNPTREENYPTVNMEAVACGTPVLTFRTGGSPEMLDETCGVVVAKNDVDALEREIVRICQERPFDERALLDKAKSFDMYDRFAEYIALYEK